MMREKKVREDERNERTKQREREKKVKQVSWTEIGKWGRRNGEEKY